MKSYMTQLMLNGKTLLRLAFLLSGMIFLSTQEVNASHIVGGDLTYRCLGNNLYEIRLTIRRDCFFGDTLAYFDDPASVGFFDGVTNQLLTFIGVNGQLRLNYNEDDTLNEILISDCSVISGDVCVHTTVYVDTILLPFRPSGYTMAYQRCCRNETLNNVLNPDATGMTLVAELSGFAQQTCNSSPQFGAYPPIYTCVNKDINYNHSAFDIEGDSLVYALCTPFAGGTQQNNRPQPPPPPPYPLVVFRPPFSLANLMGGVPLAIDPNTGVITGAPNTVGQFVIGICVTSYQDGVMTGTTRRDFQYNVRMCRDVPVANFTAPVLDCEDRTVTFNNESILSDKFLWIFDFGNPNSPTSTEFEPTFTYSADGFYNVALITNDSNEFCFDTIIRKIGVFDSQISAGFTYDVSSCTDEVVLDITNTSFDPNPIHDIVSWQYVVTTPGGIQTSSEENPQFTIPVETVSTIFVRLVVTSSNGCTAMFETSFPIQQISILLNPESDSICFGESTNLLLNGDPNLTYTWSPMTGLSGPNHNPTVSPITNTTYCVTVTDGLCEVNDCITVNVQQLPVLAFDFETDCKTLLVEFDNKSSNANLYLWDFGVTPPVTTTNPNPIFTYQTPGIYTVTLFSRDGCDVSISRNITVDAITETFDDQTLSCFSEPVPLNPGGNNFYLYDWSIDSLSGANPIVSFETTTEVFVTISSPGLPGCQIVDSITVFVPEDFTVNAGADVTTCIVSEPIILTATSNGDVDFIWTDANGNPVGNTPTIPVTSTETQTYFVTATDENGCFQIDSVTVNRPEPTFQVTASNDVAYCNIQSIDISATANVNVVFEWFNENGDPIGDGAQIQVTPGSPACFYVIATEALGCEDVDTVCLTPTFFDLSITGDQSICLEEIVQLVVTDNLNDSLSYIWSPQFSVNDTINVSPTETTTYTVFVTNEAVGCTTELSSTVVVNLFDPLDVSITASEDTIILTETTQLTVNQPSTYTYVWSSSDGGPVDNIFNPVVEPTQNPTTYTVTVTNEFGCTETASITIAVDDPACDMTDIGVPNIFSPNGDGENDVLYVLSDFISTIDFHVYNRWGEQVFHSTSQTDGWNGTYKGERLAPDVYGYYMEISCPNGKTFFKKGNITILE